MSLTADPVGIEAIRAAIQSPILRRAVDYWASKRGARAMPDRRDIEPLELRDVLGYISLIAIERNPYRFFFRLDGTKQVELFRIDCTGRYLDECFDEQHLRVAMKSYQQVSETGQPSYYRRQLPFHERVISYEIVILPLAGSVSYEAGIAADQPAMLMTVIIPDW